MKTPITDDVAAVASTGLVLPSFERVRVTIIEGAWKGEKGWITGPKNEVDANPITTDGGINLVWFDSEIRRENK
jgi:hypothetical protein